MKKNVKIRIYIAVCIILLIIAGFSAKYIHDSLNYKNSLSVENEENNDNNNVSDISASTNIINILFLGIDKTDERESWLGIYRTDTIALVRINLESKQIKVLNIPRDTYTYVPVENKKDKINHAYAFGSLNGNGVQASIDAVNYFLNNDKVVDYYFLMDMEPIPSIVDEIGGVKLDVEIDMKDHGTNLSKGLQVLNGMQAYDYIHWRYSPGGDIDRIKRQQKFIRVLYKQQRDSGKIMETLQIILKHMNDIQTDLTVKQLIGLAKFLSDLPDGCDSYYTILGDGKMIDDIDYWIPDETYKEEVFKEFFQE